VNPLVQPDPGLYIWTIVTFLVLAGLLAKFAWRPLLASLESRQKTIAGAVDDARRAKVELERVHQDAARLLVEARRESEGILTRARADADRFREELRQQATVDAANITRNAERQVQQETTRAMAFIRKEAINLSTAIASKILGRTITESDQAHLIDEVISDLDRPKA
jgi:F-type H+-transporting ATPase subunit b